MDFVKQGRDFLHFVYYLLPTLRGPQRKAALFPSRVISRALFISDNEELITHSLDYRDNRVFTALL